MTAVVRLRSFAFAFALTAVFAASSVSYAAPSITPAVEAKPSKQQGPNVPNPGNVPPVQQTPQSPIGVPTLEPVPYVNLRTQYVSNSTNGNTTSAQFRVTNQGTANATNVKLEKVCIFQKGLGSHSISTLTSHQTIGTMAPGAVIDPVVSCTPESGAKVLGITIRAHTTSTQTNTNDDHASMT